MKNYFLVQIALILLCSAAIGLKAQVMPAYGPAFPQDEVASIYITIPQDSLIEMIEMQETEHYYLATFSFQSNQLTDNLDTIGLQLRGNTSLNAEKKSFKIAFDAFDGSDRWQSLKKLNLLAQHNDPSMLRSKLALDMYRHYGIASARSGYVRLYINNEYRGLYLNVEQLDDEFSKEHFDDEGDGNLYKCTYPADLDYISNNAEDYKFANWGTRHYDLKTNEWNDDYRDLAQFINVLNNTQWSQLACELPKVFNVESYLRTVAIDILTGNWDNYAYNKNNYYLYHDQRNELITYIPFDFDNTFGIDWVGQNWSTRNIYNWSPSNEYRPLYERLMDNSDYRDKFSFWIETICNEYFNQSNIGAIATSWHDLIDDAIYEDPYYTIDYGYTNNDFDNSIDEAWGEHVNYGIIPYVNARRESALDQLESYDDTQAFMHWVAAKRIPGQVLIEALITGPEAANCSLRYSTDGLNFVTTPLSDNAGIYQLSGDELYTYYDNLWPSTGDKFYYQVVMPDGSYQPCQPAFLYTTPNPTGLYINEVMAINNTTIADEHGTYEDWLELYNGGTSTIQLDGYFISDDSSNWNKFPLPGFAMASSGFVLIWLDDDAEDGIWHSTFKLGESQNVYLTRLQDGVPRTVQYLNAIPYSADVSLELTEDGGDESAPETDPTPGYSNGVNSIEEFLNPWILNYPNPADQLIQFSKPVQNATLTDLNGKIVAQSHNSMELDVTSVASGLYLLHLDAIIVKQIIQH